MPTQQIDITTRDGQCRTFVMTPAGAGRWPAVIFYGDAGGIRPAMLEMGQRLADTGHVVVLPDLFYRHGPYKTLVPKEVFAGDAMAILGPLMASTGNDRAAQDTEALLAHIDSLDTVAGDKVGAVGFCMGGGMALYAAGTWPARFAAVASFHGGNLASDAPTSPHLQAPSIRAELYVAAADKDDLYPPAMAARLEAALDAAGVDYRAETYAGASHGWMVPDFPSHDPAAAERGWGELVALFRKKLGG